MELNANDEVCRASIEAYVKRFYARWIKYVGDDSYGAAEARGIVLWAFVNVDSRN